MLLIPCPWCGPRAQVEFTYGEDASVLRPTDPAAVSDEVWSDYIYIRENPKGLHRELWQHSGGCRMWFQVLRDTVSHDILASAPPGQPLTTPSDGGGEGGP